MNFKELKLISPILKAVADEGYKRPSPIQAQAIPLLLAGRDLLGCAQTGTGKTAAFAMPILQLLCERRAKGAASHVLRALILTPTRELALQVAQSFRDYGRYTGLKTTAIFGGVGQTPQVEALRGGVDILVATPGRLLDLLGQNLCGLGNITMFVLDEADRMLDMGFIHDVKRVIGKLPKERQTLLFSATMPQEISALAASILRDPATVSVTPESITVDAIEQSLYFVDKANKAKLLLHLLEDNSIFSALVFSRTKHGADKLSRILKKAGVPVGAIHGDKSQGARQNALASFKANKTRVLVATDIAARGIDIDQLSHVINYDLPNEPETYVHRIGRTGRAGFSGVALSFCSIDEKGYLEEIQKLTGVEIPEIEDHPYPMQVFEPTKPPPKPQTPRAGRNARATAYGAPAARRRGRRKGPGTTRRK
jgi:ATP-dependent RNA helicase RhlE